MLKETINGFTYGGDYNPEQWEKTYWEDDMRLMKKAQVNLVSIGIFSWARLQSKEGVYDFTWLDEILDLCHENGIFVDLATATASVPPWAYKDHPDIFPVDKQGNRLWYGSRQTYCPNSPSYHNLTKELVTTIVNRYKDHPALVMWHINNEYTCHVRECFCDTCAAEFRVWLKERYGTLDRLNGSWGTSFWSQWYHNWEDVMPPRQTTTQHNPGQVLDYQRFMSDSVLNCFMIEKKIIREMSPDIPITTNFMLDWKPLDYVKWAKEIDVISWDSYPNPATGVHPAKNAIDHDLMRGLADGKPFILMEQSPSQVNWRDINTVKYPGLNRLYSLQSIGHGSEGVMYFQWRQSRRGAEKFHSACITHTGDENSRVYKEVVEIGEELKAHTDISGSEVKNQVAIMYDYDNWWAVEYEPGPSCAVKYRDMILDYYTACYDANIGVDFVFQDSDISQYELVIAPLSYMVKPSMAESVKRFVASGGVFITSFFSGIVDEEDAVFENGYPGPLADILGISIEEFNPLESHMFNGITDALQSSKVTMWTELIRLKGAQAYASFTEDYLEGEPAVTCYDYEKGQSWYVGTRPEPTYLRRFLEKVCYDHGIEPVLKTPLGVEVTKRVDGENTWLFILNFNRDEMSIDLCGLSGLELLSGEEVSQKISIRAVSPMIIKLS